MRLSSRSTLALVVFALVALASLGGKPIAATEVVSPVGPKLTDKLRNLIRQEMAQMIASTNAIATAIVTGDHGTVADHADKIVAGFIMKRSLTEEDKKDLREAVPPAFLQLDAAFHETAGKLRDAALDRDSERESAYFSQMMGDCVSCHSTYARDRFPGFAN